MKNLPSYASNIVGYPLKTWTERKKLWLDLIRSRSTTSVGLCINRKYTLSDTKNNLVSRDLRKLVKEGLAIRHKILQNTYLTIKD